MKGELEFWHDSSQHEWEASEWLVPLEHQLAQLQVTESGQTSPLPRDHTSHSQPQGGVRREMEKGSGSALASSPSEGGPCHDGLRDRGQATGITVSFGKMTT